MLTRLVSTLLLLAASTALMATFAISTQRDHDSALRQERSRLDDLTQIIAGDLNTAILLAESDLARVLALNAPQTSMARKQPHPQQGEDAPVLTSLLADQSFVVGLQIFDASGKWVMASGPVQVQTSMNEALQTRFATLTPSPSPETSAAILSNDDANIDVGLSAWDRTGHLRGRGIAKINIVKLANTIAPNQPIRISVQDNTLNISLENPERAKGIGYDKLQQLMNKLKPGILSNSDQIYAFHAVGSFKIGVEAGIRTSSYLTPWLCRTLWTAVCLLIALACGIILYRHHLRILSRLHSYTNRVTFSEMAALAEASQLQSVLHIATDGIHILDARGYLQIASDSFYKMHGYTRETAVGLHVSDWNKYYPKETWNSRLESAITQNSVQRFESRHQRADGSEFEVEITLQAFTFHNAPHLFCSIHDISERKTNERKLQESEKRFRSLIEGTTDWVWETDTEHRFSFVQETEPGRHAVDCAELIGHRPWDIAVINPDNKMTLEQLHRDMDSQKLIRDLRFWYHLAPNQELWLSINGTPYFDDAGAFCGYRGTYTDVTDESLMSEHLKLLSSTIEFSPVATFITDSHFITRYANHKAIELSGYSLTELLDHQLWIFQDGCIPSTDSIAIRSRLSSQPLGAWEVEGRTKHGERIWLQLSINTIKDQKGSIKNYIALIEDSSKRKNDEKELLQSKVALERQTRKLISANNELRQIAYVSAHDLRQPIRMVNSYLGLIRENIGHLMSERVYQFFDFALQGGRQLDILTQDLLEYSSIGINDNVERVNLNSVMNEVQVELSKQIFDSNTQIILNDHMPEVQSSHIEMTHLFRHLIGNAIKYRSPDRPPAINISCQEFEAEWRLCFKDNGIGIAPESHERIFQMFQRSTSGKFQDGTGIGLAICKKVVDRLGGRIWVESTPGEGSTFFVTIPKTIDQSL